MEGLSLHPKGAAALLHRKGESPLQLNTKRGLMPRMEGSHCNRRGPVALLPREGEPRPTLSTQCNSRRRREGSHYDRREPWPCCTGRESPVRCWISMLVSIPRWSTSRWEGWMARPKHMTMLGIAVVVLMAEVAGAFEEQEWKLVALWAFVHASRLGARRWNRAEEGVPYGRQKAAPLSGWLAVERLARCRTRRARVQTFFGD
ncbi:hypothetical protein ROHU_009050 [Labeo rohita]|uniref:Uncharacterized protein n=1 Tax=Labeo rohita TaxID=84645 RepID=A0A498MBN2_LABRO|nr:hypothetical protein ROHU_009050 [Labeo rohita]